MSEKNELESPRDYVPASVLAKQGVAAIGYAAGGILLLAMNILGGRFRILGIVLGLIAGGVGAASLRSRDPEDRKPGAILCAAGVVELVFQFGIPILKPIAGTLLGAGALGLLVMGVVKGIKFLKGLMSRR